jgi:hypothetical protein
MLKNPRLEERRIAFQNRPFSYRWKIEFIVWWSMIKCSILYYFHRYLYKK